MKLIEVTFQTLYKSKNFWEILISENSLINEYKKDTIIQLERDGNSYKPLNVKVNPIYLKYLKFTLPNLTSITLLSSGRSKCDITITLNNIIKTKVTNLFSKSYYKVIVDSEITSDNDYFSYNPYWEYSNKLLKCSEYSSLLEFISGNELIKLNETKGKLWVDIQE